MKELIEWIKSIVLAVIIVIPIMIFCRPTLVIGSSMVPTLDDKNVVVMRSGSKGLKRGDIIVFDARPFESRYFIKRIIGMPNDKVDIKNGYVYVNGNKVNEYYLKEGTLTTPDKSVVVPKDSLFVLGDNRPVSEDSRYIGMISIKKVKGHAYFRIFPFSKFGTIK